MRTKAMGLRTRKLMGATMYRKYRYVGLVSEYNTWKIGIPSAKSLDCVQNTGDNRPRSGGGEEGVSDKVVLFFN